jgi:hypothetical protein
VTEEDLESKELTRRRVGTSGAVCFGMEAYARNVVNCTVKKNRNLLLANHLGPGIPNRLLVISRYSNSRKLSSSIRSFPSRDLSLSFLTVLIFSE